ncbi:transposase [Sediminibacterium goheungense]|uniref:Transposase IS200 family protein n=1 Tax=Sediminibacterium goheungense TaxID=1086393 RepID=A0A4R6IVS3_9BACT|nr:transposase [Sediminibacterium goheungense]TDO26789.1 transposase IS200 family protein [Sediminibacterium goheungense]
MLHPGQFYHLYNHANGSENLFREEKNYHFFLEKAGKYLSPYMNIYAYCLMPNHFHLLISIKEEKQLHELLSKSNSFKKMSEINQIQYMYNKISKSLSNLFSSYTQSYNRIYQRRGSLFMPNFKTNDIENDLAFCAITHYIHANPVHHGFVKDIREWKYSSFQSLCSDKPTKLERDYVLAIFGNKQAFLNYHAKPIDRKYKWHD